MTQSCNVVDAVSLSHQNEDNDFIILPTFKNKCHLSIIKNVQK
jgi:hypothetical protein